MNIIETISADLGIKAGQTEAAVKLIDEGNTIPFIARYRKEAHGSLDDQVLRELSDRLAYLRNLNDTRDKIRALIDEQGKLTEEISEALDAARTLTEIEDIYRPYRPKRKTRASIAKAKGLDPLAQAIYEQRSDSPSPLELAAAYVDPEKDVADAEQALAGAKDIIAELISDDAELRKRLRYVCMMNSLITSKAVGEDIGVYENYADFSEPASKIASHRVLAINRGEREEKLKVTVEFDRTKAMSIIKTLHIKDSSPCTAAVTEAAEDAYDRLIFPSLEREIRNTLTENADESAMKVFSVNLRNLLMQPPVRGKVALGLDPGYRTGCKVAVVDATGKVLDTGVIFPVEQFGKTEQAKRLLRGWIEKHGVEIIAIGNGTASHETEVFAAGVIKEYGGKVSYMVVSEAGASVYSASKLAAEEFPDYDVSLRSAVSIARRLQDPLAELVKIDPKAIGIGQYQHDMPQARLTDALTGVVEDCVNSVGVDLNTASVQLLSRVSGINAAIAKNIVGYRQENGAFRSRSALLKVPKLGPKAFQQCAGFLRIPGASNPLDNTSVHPESYEAAELLLRECGYSDADLGSGLPEIDERVQSEGIEKLAEKTGVGVPTLNDIIKELKRPGRDVRDELPPPMLRTDVMSLEDLTPGMELTGTVRNVTDFGAFIDIGVHEDGLVHISQICSKYIKHPSEVLKVGDIVKVWVLSADAKKKRISLTMKESSRPVS